MPNTFFIKTTLEWASTSMNSYIIPRGDLCIETFDDGNMKLKIGDGLRVFKQLPYICHGHDDKKYDYYTKEEIDKMFDDITIDLDNYYNKIEINELMTSLRSNLIQYIDNNTHYHHNKAILDQITAPFTREEKEKLANIIDVSGYAERIEVLESIAHTHDNKNVLDLITLADVNNWHVHSNKTILDNTTASFTVNYKNILDNLVTYNVFEPASAYESGSVGLVPAPNVGDHVKFLRGDGKWVSVEAATIPIATTETLGGIIAGDGLSVDEDGVLSTSGVLSITQDQTDENVLVIEYPDHTDQITLPLSDDTYNGGIATEIRSGIINYPDIPSEYQYVEYIESDATQYIDTGYIHQAGNCFFIDAELLKDNTLATSQQVVFGAYTTDGGSYQKNQVSWYMNDISIYQYTLGIAPNGAASYSYTTNGFFDTRVNAYLYNNKLDVYRMTDSAIVRLSVSYSVSDGANTLAIFCKHVDTNFESKSKMRLYKFSIYSRLAPGDTYSDDYLIKSYYPVYRKSDGVAGLYDVISQTFVTSPVGNPFTVGSNIYPDSYKFIDVRYADGLNVNDNNELIVTPSTSSALGGVIIGDGINVDENGVISVDSHDVVEYLDGDAIELRDESIVNAPFIKFNGSTSVFDTGVVHQAHDKFEVILREPNVSNKNRTVFGSRIYNIDSNDITLTIDSNQKFAFDRSSTARTILASTSAVSTDIVYKIIIQDKSCDIYNYETGELIEHIGDADEWLLDDGLYTLSIGNVHNRDYMQHSNLFGDMELYEFKWYRDDVLIHDWVPYQNDSLVALYDNVTESVLQAYAGANGLTYGTREIHISGLGSDKTINVLYADGLAINNNNQLYTTGVLDVSINPIDDTKLNISFWNETKTIQLTGTKYTPGEAIDISTESLDSDYIEIEYIETYNPNNTQDFSYFDTGYIPGPTTNIELVIAPSRGATEYTPAGITRYDNGSYATHVFGIAWNNTTGTGVWFNRADQTSNYGGQFVELSEDIRNKKTTFKTIGNTLYVYNENGNLLGSVTDSDAFTANSPYSLPIFVSKIHQDAPYSNDFMYGKFYELYIREGDELVHHFIPCKTADQTAFGIYDTITKSFRQISRYGNGGQINLGPEVSGRTFETKINVLYNDGLDVNNDNELINTGVLDLSLNPTDSTKLDISFWNETKTIQFTGTAYTAGVGIDISEREIIDDAYEKLEYIESDGTQYIDTGYYHNPDDWYCLTCTFIDDNNAQLEVALGANDFDGSIQTNMLMLWSRYNGATVNYELNDTGTQSSTTFTTSTLYDTKIDNYLFRNTINVHNADTNDLIISRTLEKSLYSITGHPSLTLMGRHWYSTTDDEDHYDLFAKLRIYRFRIWPDYEHTSVDDRRDESLIADYVPVKRLSDSKIGLYDVISKTFVTSTVGNTFTYRTITGGNDKVINNTGALDIENVYDVLNITFADSTKSIKLYNPGDGIEFENTNSGSTLAPRIKYFRFDITKIRGNNQWVQMEELEFSHNGTVIRGNGVSIAGYKFDGSTPNYSTTGGAQTAAQLIDNDLNTKLCARFDDDGHSYIKIILSINGEGISPNEVFQYQYFTGDDEPDRDPVSWQVYVSADGARWTLVDQHDNATINTARTAPAFDKITLDMSDYINAYADRTFTNVNVKPATTTDIGGIIVGDGLSITNNGVLSVDTITIDDYVISVTQDEEFANILHVEYPDGTVDITLPQSEGQVEVDEPEEELLISGSYSPVGAIYKAGPGISITKQSGGDRYLPDAYKQIQYIESNEFDQFLDTKILVIPGIKVECDCEVSDAVKDAYQGIFGTKYANNWDCFIFWTRFSGQNIPCFASPSSGEVTGTGFIYNTRIKIVATQSGASWYLNDSLVGSINGSGNWSYDKPIILFGAAKEGHVESGCKAKCYEFKAYNGDTLTNDLIPCVEIATGEVGMYDLIANKFCKAVDDGTEREPFVAGPDLITDNVIKNTGVLDVSVNEEDDTVLDVTFYDQTKHIQMSGGSSYDDTELRSLISALTQQVQTLQTELNTLKTKAVLSDDIKHIDKVTMDEYMSMVRSNDTMYLINDEAGELEPSSSVVPTDTLATSMDNVDIMIIGDLEEVE